MIVAVDFDGTLFKWAKFPDVGEPVPYAIDTLVALVAHGHELVLWTCRKDEGLELAKQAMVEHGVGVHHYNKYPDSEHLSVKVNADIFIDDKAAGCPLVYPDVGRPYVDWLEIQRILDKEGYFQ